MLSHVLTFALLVVPADVAGKPVELTPDSGRLTKLTVDDMSLTAQAVQFKSDNGSQTCRLEGNAKVRIGDIAITADRIQCNGKLERLVSLVCTGNCTWQQDDGSGVFSGDKLELRKDGLRLTGNVSLRYGSGDHVTVDYLRFNYRQTRQ